MMSEDERFEEFLRQFTPRRPSQLQVRSTGRPIAWTVAAAAVLAVAFISWNSRDVPAPRLAEVDVPAADPVTRGRSTFVADWDVEAVDRMLMDVSRRVLPDVERRDSSLYQLSRQ